MKELSFSFVGVNTDSRLWITPDPTGATMRVLELTSQPDEMDLIYHMTKKEWDFIKKTMDMYFEEENAK